MIFTKVAMQDRLVMGNTVAQTAHGVQGALNFLSFLPWRSVWKSMAQHGPPKRRLVFGAEDGYPETKTEFGYHAPRLNWFLILSQACSCFVDHLRKRIVQTRNPAIIPTIPERIAQFSMNGVAQSNFETL